MFRWWSNLYKFIKVQQWTKNEVFRPGDLFTFSEEILSGKLYFLCSGELIKILNSRIQYLRSMYYKVFRKIAVLKKFMNPPESTCGGVAFLP